MCIQGRVGISTLVVIGLLAATAGARCAEARGPGWGVRVEGVRIEPNLDRRTFSGEGAAIDLGGEGDTGFGVALEYGWSRRIGFELGYFQVRPEVRVVSDFGLGGEKLALADDLEERAISAGLMVHLTPERAVDLSIRPMIALVSYGDVNLAVDLPEIRTQRVSLDVERDIAWGLGLGVEVPFGESGWRATASIRYLNGTLDLRGRGDDFEDRLSFDSTLVTVGVGYRF